MAEILSAISIVLGIGTLLFVILLFRRDGGAPAQFDTLSQQQHEALGGLQTQLAVLQQQFDRMTKLDAEEFQRSRLESSQYQREMREDTAKALREMTDKLSDMTRANYEHQQKLTDTVSQSLHAIRDNNVELNERQSRVLESTIAKMQESNEKRLDQMRETVDEKLTATLSTRLDSSFKTVSEQLENVYKSLGEMKELSTGVTDNISSLNRVLTNVKARGTWAEVQLESILDQTIPKMYDKNVATKEGSADRVEFAVRIPSNDDSQTITYLPIDSKFPMEDYIRLCDAADRGDADALAKARKALEDRVKQEAKAVKGYINEPRTTPFAILYLATEGLYAEIASSRSGLPEKLLSENIMVAGPATITALLNSLAIGFRAVTINEKANEVRKILGAAKTQYAKFGVVLEKAKKKIDEAGRSLEDAQNRNRIIQKNLRSVEEIEHGEAEAILGLDAPENTDVPLEKEGTEA